MSVQLFSVPLPESKSDPAARKLPHFLRVEEVADLLRCKKRTIYDMVEQRRIPYRRVGGRLLFDLAEEGLRVLLLEEGLSYSPPRSPAGCNRKGEC